MWRKLFYPEHILKKEEKLGPLPSAKDAYHRMYKIAMPSTVEAVLSGLTGFVDTLMVSAIGISSVTAVGITTQPRMIILMLFMALNTGVTALIARRKGENDGKRANEILMQSLLICVLLSIVMTVVGAFTAEPLLKFAGAGADFLEDAVDYYQIINAGTIFAALTMTINAAQRGAGNTRVAMTTNIVSNAVNIVFNFLLIEGRLGFPAMGVKGAAFATVIGLAAGLAIAIFSLHKSTFIYFDVHSLKKLDFAIIKSIVKISGGAAFEELCFRVGFFMYNKMVAELGTLDYGTHLICMNILNLSNNLASGLGIGTTALVGQTMGEKRSDLSVMYVKIGQRIGFIIAVLLSFVFIFAGRQLMWLFTDDISIIENGYKILFIMAAATFFINSQIVFSGCLRGAGDVRFVATIALVSVAVVRPILSYVLTYPLGLGLVGAWLGLIIDQFMRGSAGRLRFATGKWKNIEI